MSGLKIEGSTSGNALEVDSGNHVTVNLGLVKSQAGFALQLNQNDPGTITGSPYLLSPECSDDFRQRSSIDTIVMTDTFNYAAQDSGKWSNILSSFTVTYASGFMILNGGLSITTAQGALVKSYRTIPMYGASPVYVEFHALYTQTPQANNVMELGVGIPTTSNGALTDGVCFRWDATGVLKGVMNYNGTETFTSALTVPAANSVMAYKIVITTDEVQFWIYDVLQAEIAVPVGAGAATAEASLPIIMRCYNSGAVTTAQQLKVSQCNATFGDWATNKPWGHIMTALGQHCASAQGGSTAGNTSNNANSATPATSGGTNALAGYATLGGQFAVAAIASVETDFIIFGYQNPVPAVGVTGKQLFITDIHIDTYNTVVAVGAGPTVFQWALAYGSTALTLLTTEAAATKVPRRLNIGFQGLAAASAVGTMATPTIDRQLTTPICVNPGEFLHVILKMPVGTLTATELYRGIVSLIGYWE